MSDKNAEGFMMIEGLPESVGIEKESVFEKEVWNRAIDKVLDIVDDSELYAAIGKLKK
jgi:hypothetical protein